MRRTRRCSARATRSRRAGPFGEEFPVADPDAGIPADERALPPLSEAEQLEVEREADREADQREADERRTDA